MASKDPSRFPSWSWSNAQPAPPRSDPAFDLHHRVPGSFDDDDDMPQPPAQPRPQQSQAPPQTSSSAPRHDTSAHQRHWPSRTCRICLETVPPTFQVPSDALPSFLTSRKPRVTYVSDDPSLGRLIRPCKCKGSSRYVHEGCLRSWRHSEAGYSARNYWSCPTCGFKYRLRRLGWGSFISSTAMQLGLTMLIFFVVVFALGFVADPIIQMYVDPYDAIANGVRGRRDYSTWAMEEEGWLEHFLKGFAGLGLLGFLKALMAMSWVNWWNFRGALPGQGGVRMGGSTGRDRLGNLSLIVVLVGAGTFLWVSTFFTSFSISVLCEPRAWYHVLRSASMLTMLQTVYKAVRAWSRRTLEHASEKVMDVPLDDDEEEFVDDDASTKAAT